MQIAFVHQIGTNGFALTIFKENIVRKHDRSASFGLEVAIDMLEKGKLFIGCGKGEVVTGGHSATFFSAERRITENDIGFGEILSF